LNSSKVNFLIFDFLKKKLKMQKKKTNQRKYIKNLFFGFFLLFFCYSLAFLKKNKNKNIKNQVMTMIKKKKEKKKQLE